MTTIRIRIVGGNAYTTTGHPIIKEEGEAPRLVFDAFMRGPYMTILAPGGIIDEWFVQPGFITEHSDVQRACRGDDYNYHIDFVVETVNESTSA